MSDGYRILFGDIHNHNAMGYGVGSMVRSIDIARRHLDFFAFTGHSSWHDMVPMEGGREQHWLTGFEKLKDGWAEVQALIADANQDDQFGAFLGFEWHSSKFGDQCVVFPDDHQPIHYAQDIDELRRFCQSKNALMIPHHLAYPTGMRGVNWSVFDSCCTPVVEIFSEHGNSEHDRGGFDYFSHSMGGRVTDNTARAALDRGLQFGFVASSDSHNGFPGAYGEGLLGVLSKDLNRAAILEAINARRTYALTGDRIEVDFTVDGAVMGQDVQAGKSVEVAFDVRGRDEMDVVEIVQDGDIVHRAHGFEQRDPAAALSQPIQIRLEWGWGPWGDLALDRVADWQFDVQVQDGRLRQYFPCLQSGPFDENRRHAFQETGENSLAVTSYTARHGAYRLNPNNSMVMELDAASNTAITLDMQKPAAQQNRVVVGDLLAGSANLRTDPFPKEAYQFHRAIPAAASRVTGKVQLQVPNGRSYIYLRTRQTNGHIAWASPVFINYR